MRRRSAIHHRLLPDGHPDSCSSYNNLAANLNVQGKYAQAQVLFEKALEMCTRVLADEHPETTASYNHLAANLNAQGRYEQVRDLWLRAVKGHATQPGSKSHSRASRCAEKEKPYRRDGRRAGGSGRPARRRSSSRKTWDVDSSMSWPPAVTAALRLPDKTSFAS